MTTISFEIINFVYVDGGSVYSPFYNFYTDSSASTTFSGTLNLDEKYRFLRVDEAAYFPFSITDSSFITVSDSSGNYEDGISGDQTFDIEFTTTDVADISLVVFVCDTDSTMTGTFGTALSSTTIDVTNLQQVTSYDTLLLQSDLCNNIYFLDVADTSGYVFELTLFDTSNGFTMTSPTFDSTIQQDLGLEDVSAVATIDVSLSIFNNLFALQSDSDSIDDLAVNDLTFGVNISNSAAGSVFSDISFSNATVVENQVNSYYSDQEIYNDFVRNLAFQITGGYNGVDLFTNEDSLTQGVKDLDSSFQTTFNTIMGDLIEDTSTNGFKSITSITALTQDDELYKAAIALYMINANSGASSQRFTGLLDDISAASDGIAGTVTVPLTFFSGDKIAIRVLYNTDSARYSITSRSYKVLLNLLE